MIVPEFWAEARIQKRFPERQITVRRFGWSDESPEAAQQHAQERVEEAFQRIVDGQPLPRRELKVRYNGADGLPIREEILERVGEHVVTRNSYGARCLNSPNVFFADVDFAKSKSDLLIGCMSMLSTVLIVGYIAPTFENRLAQFVIGWALLLSAIWLGWLIGKLITRLICQFRKDDESTAIDRVRRVFSNRPDWHVRVYRTPNGLRILALHKLFDPRSAQVERVFKELRVDFLYRIMCQKQNCFRARLTAKPWRIGIKDRLKPRPGVWPIKPEHLPRRDAWVAEYESSAGNFAACRFLFALGPVSKMTEETRVVQEYHDRICNAHTVFELA